MSVQGRTSKMAPDQLLDFGRVRVECEDDDAFQEVDASESIIDPHLQRNKSEIPTLGLKKRLLTEAKYVILLGRHFCQLEGGYGKGNAYFEDCSEQLKNVFEMVGVVSSGERGRGDSY
jgi:hypothetical protein